MSRFLLNLLEVSDKMAQNGMVLSSTGSWGSLGGSVMFASGSWHGVESEEDAMDEPSVDFSSDHEQQFSASESVSDARIDLYEISNPAI